MSTEELKDALRTICACELGTPCSYACSCAHPLMSGGCQRCASYGSDEQKLAAALFITSQPLPEKRAPVQGFSAGIPWSMHLRAYDAYSKKHRPQEAMIDLEGRNCRGGFGVTELDEYIPGWRDELSMIARLQRQIDHLLPNPWPRYQLIPGPVGYAIGWRHNDTCPWIYWSPDPNKSLTDTPVRFGNQVMAEAIYDLLNSNKSKTEESA